MIPAVIAFLHESGIPECTIILPNIKPRPSWWSLVARYSAGKAVLGRKGECGVVNCPSKHGYAPDTRGLKWDLIAFRLNFTM